MGDFNPLTAEDPKRVGVYLLVGRLGHDPHQAVYLGHLPDQETLRVIRILPPCPDADPQVREQITNRLHAAQRISGAHTAKLIEVGWFDDSPYIVREHVEGRSLRETVEADGPLAADALERLAVGTLTALTAIHLAGLAHGSLNPDTVLLSAEGPRVCDTGLGIAGAEPDYHAPEQVHANLTGIAGPGPGRPSDLFAWAATIAYAATGRAPFSGDPRAVLNGSPDLSGLSPALTALLSSCLDKQPQLRPDTKAAMLQLLGDQSSVRITGEHAPQAVLEQPGAAVPQPAAPSGWGVPPLPQDTPPATQPPIVLQMTASPEGRKTGGVPVALAASVGVVALLAGLGLWAAGNYTSLNNVERASAEGAADRPLELVQQSRERDPYPTQGPGGQGQDPAQDPGQDPVDKVTVPWGTTPDPQVPDVGPLKLGAEEPTAEPPVPTLTSFATPPVTPPVAVPVTPPVAVPTVPAPVPPTGTPTAQASAQTPPTPAARRHRTKVEPSEAPTPTPTVTVTVTPTQTPSGGPSQAPASATPTASPTAPPATQSAAQPTTASTSAPAAAPTSTRTAKPAPTWSVRPATKTPTPPPAVKPTSGPTHGVSIAPTTPKPPTQAPVPPTAKPTWQPPRSNPYTPQQVCGAGFYVQRSASFAGGATYQLYNSSTGSNCVVTMKTADLGTATSVWATLEVQNGESKTDRGTYEYYAGPVILSAKGKCVRFTGGGPSGNTGAGWGNCG